LPELPRYGLAGYNGRDSVSATRSEGLIARLTDSWMTTFNFHGLRWSHGLFCRSKRDPRSLMRFKWSCNKDAESPSTVILSALQYYSSSCCAKASSFMSPFVVGTWLVSKLLLSFSACVSSEAYLQPPVTVQGSIE
jgi:hypothetical protein